MRAPLRLLLAENPSECPFDPALPRAAQSGRKPPLEHVSDSQNHAVPQFRSAPCADLPLKTFTLAKNMDYDLLWKISDRARSREKLTATDARFVREVLPHELAAFPRIAFPSRVRHPAGFSISGAPVRTFLHCALLLSARRVLGPRYGGTSEFYDRVEADLAFGIMRSHFHHDFPKGTHCCAQCTLAVYPVLEAQTIRWFDCGELAVKVRKLIETKQWRFSKRTNPQMIDWALNEKSG